MPFEALANELLLDVFDYLTTAQQFHAFHNLSLRFNGLLLHHLRLYGHFDFESMSHTSFQVVCQAYLPQLTNQVISMHLFDDGESLEQTDLFLVRGYQFRQFPHLKSLCLSYIYSEETMRSIITELPHLEHLTHFQLKYCQIDHELVNNGWIFDQVWRLRRLSHCRFERRMYLWNPFFIASKRVSTSIEYLHLVGFIYNSEELHRLLENTTHLRYLNIALEHNYDQQEIPPMISSLRKLDISVQYSPHVTSGLLQQMPNLMNLTINVSHLVVDGNQLEEMITNGLPNLKVFHLKMEVHRRCNNAADKQVDQLLESFRGSFWTVQHQWYVQCHWYTAKKFLKAYLYTLPCELVEFSLNTDLQFRSTCPKNEIQWSYDHVRRLTWQDSENEFIHFDYVDQLRLLAPMNDCLWSTVPNLHRLRSSSVKLSNVAGDETQLQHLLRRATGLYSLTLEDGMLSYEHLFSLQSSSIRQLDLRGFGRLDDKQCHALALSPLGTRCEVLSATVTDRTSVLTLANQMTNLRVLHVRCEDDQWNRTIDDGQEDELVSFLKDSLPRNCVIRREKSNSYARVKLWIR